MTDSELPRATVMRIVRDETGMRVSTDAKEAILEATEQFVRNLAHESCTHDFFDERKTIKTEDIEHILNDKRYKRMIPRTDD